MDSSIRLYPHQEKALDKLSPGSILHGGVGSGKTLTALSYYKLNFPTDPLVVITTAKKRDSHDWEDEAELAGVHIQDVDSWNNIGKYIHLSNAFFIFDEQRLVSYGSWVKSFLKIAERNTWILLSATPGDVWMDYLPVFLANGFYRNKTDFINQHVEYDRFAKYPKVKCYHNQYKLAHFRDITLVDMEYEKSTTRHEESVICEYDHRLYSKVQRDRWNPFKEKPIETSAELAQCLRRAVASSEDRRAKCQFIFSTTPKCIVFYNYDYELDILRQICEENEMVYAEWNGHNHEEIPDSKYWVYLVQYTAGSEGWNCIETDTIIFFSPNYAYRTIEQSEGRIDRLNTEFTDLYYTFLLSESPIDKAVMKAYHTKTKFNEKRWGDRYGQGKQVSSKPY